MNQRPDYLNPAAGALPRAEGAAQYLFAAGDDAAV